MPAHISVYGDPRLLHWNGLFSAGAEKRAILLDELERDLRTPQPHPFAAYVWIRAHQVAGDLPVAWAALQDKILRAKLETSVETALYQSDFRYPEMLRHWPASSAGGISDPWTLDRLGGAAMDLTRYEDALDYELAALRHRGDWFAAAWNIVAIANRDEELRPKIASAFAPASELGRTPAAGYIRMQLANRPYKEDQSLAAVDGYLKLAPDDGWALRYKAQLLRAKGNFTDALPPYRQSQMESPFLSTDVPYLLLVTGHRDEAEKDLRSEAEALTRPADADAWFYLEWLRVMDRAASMEFWPGPSGTKPHEEDVLALAQAAAGKYPANVDLQIFSADYALNHAGNKITEEQTKALQQAARNAYQTALAQDPANPEYALGLLHRSEKWDWNVWSSIRSRLHFVSAELYKEVLRSFDLALPQRIELCHDSLLQLPEEASLLAVCGAEFQKQHQYAASVAAFRRSFALNITANLGHYDSFQAALDIELGPDEAARELRALASAAAWNKDLVHSLQIALDQNRLVLGDIGGHTVRLELRPQTGHSMAAETAVFSRDGHLLVTGGGELHSNGNDPVVDGSIRLWDTTTGQLLRVFAGHDRAVTKLAISPDGKYVVSTAEREEPVRIKVWSVASGEIALVNTLPGDIDYISFSSDGKLLQVLTSLEVGVWEIATGKRLKSLPTNHPVHPPATGESVISELHFQGSDHAGSTVLTVQDVQTHAEHVHVELDRGPEDLIWSWPHRDLIRTTSDGRLYAVTQSAAALVDVETGKVLRNTHFRDAPGEGGVHPLLAPLAFSSDGKRWAATDPAGSVFLVSSETDRATVQMHTAASSANAAVLSPNGRFLAIDGDGKVCIWDLSSGVQLSTISLSSSASRSRASDIMGPFLSFSPDGKLLARAGKGEVELIRTADWKVAKTIPHPGVKGVYSEFTTVVFSPDSHMLAMGARSITLLDIPSGTLREIASGSDIPSIQQRSVGPRDLVFRPGAMVWKRIRADAEPTRIITSLAFSPSGEEIAAGYFTEQTTVVLWRLRDGNLLWRNSERASLKDVGYARFTFPTQVAFSPDAKWIAAARPIGGEVALLDPATGETARALNMEATGIAFLSPSRPILSEGKAWTEVNPLAKMKKGEDGRLVPETIAFGRSDDEILSAAPGPRNTLLTTSADNTVAFWNLSAPSADVPARKELTLVSMAHDHWAAVDSDGRFDASNGGQVEGLHWVYGLEPISLAQLKDRYYDPGLVAKTLGFNAEPPRGIASAGQLKLFPAVEFVPPAAGSTQLTIHLRSRGGGIGRVQVLIDGTEWVEDARKLDKRPGGFPASAASATLVVELKGSNYSPGEQNNISVIARNQEDYLASRGNEVIWTAPGTKPSAPPELYGIVIGTSRFASDAVRPLLFPDKDAQQFGDALATGAKRLFGADKAHITILTTSSEATRQPTKQNIAAAFAAARVARPSDVIVVYLAGHGVVTHNGAYAYLTRDAQSTTFADPAVIQQVAVTSDELTDWIKQIPARKKMLVLDTCAAGAAAAKLVEVREVSGDQIRSIDRMKDRTGFHILMGSAADAVSYEASRYGQGLLTYALLQGMKGAALREGQYVDVDELFHYAADSVPQLAASIGGIQKPQIAAPQGDSFDVGLLSEAERSAIPLSRSRPLLLRPRLFDPDAGDDDLNLNIALERVLAAQNAATVRGPGTAPPLFVDADEMSGAIRIAGTYSVDGDDVKLSLTLREDNKIVKTIKLVGKKDSTAQLAETIMNAVNEAFTPME